MRLIDLDELLKFPMRRDTYDRENGDKRFINGVESVLEYAENLPTVNIVRCKDCEFWYAGKTLLPNINACRLWSTDGSTRYTADMDFCNKGERADV